MMPNFKKLTKQYQTNACIALQQFVRIDSVYDASSAKKNQPFGQGVKKALDYVAKLGNDFGFKVDKCDGYCTELTIGDEGPIIGIYAHSDVVPISGKWDLPPFSGQLKDGRIWGRGSIDDKGPLIASLYAIKALKDAGLIKGYRVRLVSGGDEERGSSCLEYYFHTLHKEQAKYGFTPDADFPLIYGEKAIRRYALSLEEDLGPIIAMEGGVVANAVCDKLMVTMKKDEKFLKKLKDDNVNVDISEAGDVSILSFKGKSAHGSTPEEGVNAASIAFKLLGGFYSLKNLSKFGDAISSPDGKVWGGYSHSKELLDATYNYGVIKYDGKVLTSTLDFRFGEEANPDELIQKLEKYVGLKAEMVSDTKALLFDTKSTLVSTLMKSYKRQTLKFFDKPFTIGGGTYAKECENTVAFGAVFNGHPGNMHSPNEYMYVEDFNKCMAIYADAIYSLGEAAKK